MLRSLAIGVLFVTILSGAVHAQGNFGIGLIVGEPTGISAKMWLMKRTAVDAAAAWSFSDDAALHLHADYLFHNFDLIEVSKGQLPVYFGAGARVKFESDSKLGVRIPVGLAYILEGAPLDLFAEIVPLVDLVPDTEFELNGSIGIRYFFGGTGTAE